MGQCEQGMWEKRSAWKEEEEKGPSCDKMLIDC